MGREWKSQLSQLAVYCALMKGFKLAENMPIKFITVTVLPN